MLTFFRLFSLAPRIVRCCPFGCRRVLGVAMDFLPLRYAPVNDSSDPSMVAIGPWATTFPPCSPAPGPRSTMWSAARITASSCSTISTVLPTSRKFLSVSMSLSPSCGCNPTEGSSHT